MDRGRLNLEALAEEEDEEEVENTKRDSSDDSDSSGDEEPDPSARREPNKFDNLCDGVLNSMALVHGSIRELLDMKDEMLKHALPPTLLIKLATITGKVFRSISDLNMPVNELVRLVHVYSTPWEEKSTALKKLHEDYESKQRQLNIAIKRLQLVDAHSKRIAREKRIMNWEKLFAKIMSNKGHGRRWKFLIETIKQKAQLGLEHVQEYSKALEESSDEEGEDDEMPIKLNRHDDGADSDKLSDLEEEEAEEGVAEEESEKAETPAEEGEEEEEEKEDKETKEETEGANSRVGTPKKVRFADEEKVEPTKEVSTWTHEPQYDNFLFMRVFTPTGLDQKDIKCMIQYGAKTHKTARLDPEDSEAPAEQPKPKAKGLIGSKGKALQETESDSLQKKKKAEEKATKSRFEEMSFDLPEEVPDGVWTKPTKEEPQNIQVSVHVGPQEEIFAMATIDMEDIKALNLKEVYLPEPHGDDDVPTTPRGRGGRSDVGDFDSLSDDVEISLPGEDVKKQPEPVSNELVKDIEAVPFPLLSVNPAKGDSMHASCGTLPLVMYIGKRLKPQEFNRQCGTMTLNSLVFDMTGIDLDTWRKEDLNKEMRDQASSALHLTPEPPKEPTPPPPPPKEPTPPPPKEPTPPPPKEPTPPPPPKEPTPEPKEEMVTKREFDEMMDKHNNDLRYIQEEYEKRLQQLTDSLQLMEETRFQMQEQLKQQQQQQQQQIQYHQQQLLQQQHAPRPQQRPLSQESRRSASSATRREAQPQPPPLVPLNTASPTMETMPVPPRSSPMRPETAPDARKSVPMPSVRRTKPARPSRPTPQHWGPGIPEDFLDRLAWFEEESNKHKEEMVNKISKQIQEDIERKLAGQHKLSKKEEEMYDALKDVSLPALFMPYKRGTVFNPRAHQYFHPNGSSDLRLTQPPSMIQLPPLPNKSKMSVLNLFELSRNFNRGQAWLMEKYIQQQEPAENTRGMVPITPAPTADKTGSMDGQQQPDIGTTQMSNVGTSNADQEVDLEM
ncbi:protein piccolo-like [Ylistrum balloti]|uniref:protein piccolo-like n=1 Tax=Ylistrum balloti TaxID=509963 RepID=UPI002905EF7B|nr:protein piccolo-like [Ylistrum balloti]